VRRNYDGLLFDRRHSAPDSASRVLGVGHPAIDQALRQAAAWAKSTSILPAEDLHQPIIVFRATDRITGSGGQVRYVVIGIEVSSDAQGRSLLCDWRLLLRLNELVTSKRPRNQPPTKDFPKPEVVRELVFRAESVLSREVPSLDLPFRFPTLDLLAVLWPDTAETHSS